MGYFDGWFDSGGVDDFTPPVITKVSPVDFNLDYSVARVQPVVIDITDIAPGVVMIVVTMGSTVVYFGSPTGAYGSAFTGSSFVAITNGYRLSFYPTAGWSSGPLTLSVTALDADGNVATLAISLNVPYATVDTIDGSPQELRDSIWRWTRRLRRQKCSVISVSIDDNYSVGPGFILTALSLELGKRKGLDRVPWRGGSTTSPHGTSDINNGR